MFVLVHSSLKIIRDACVQHAILSICHDINVILFHFLIVPLTYQLVILRSEATEESLSSTGIEILHFVQNDKRMSAGYTAERFDEDFSFIFY